MRRSGGFSLIEILMAVLIAGIVAAIAIPVFNGQRDRAKDGRAQAELEHAVKQARSVWTSSEGFSAGAADRMRAGEQSLDLQAGSAFPATAGSINVETTSDGLVALRSLSASGRQRMIVDDPERGVTVRYSGDPAMTTVTNLAPNPSVEGPGHWLAAAFTGGTKLSERKVTDDGYRGTSSYEATFNSAGGNAQIYPVANNSSQTPPASAGQRVFGRAAFKVVQPAGVTMCLDIGFYRSDKSFLTQYSGPCVTSTGAWQQLSWSSTAPASSAFAYISVRCATVANPVTYRVDAALIVIGTSLSPAYFDGSWPGASWTGTANDSPSSGPAGSESW